MNLMPAASLSLAPRLSQKIKLTAGMRQALCILQMPHLDLKNFLEEEIAANPLLEEKEKFSDDALFERLTEERDLASFAHEEKEDPDEGAVREMPAEKNATIHDHLLVQWNLLDLPASQRLIGKEIIGDLDGNGYLASPLEDIAENCAADILEAEKVLLWIQKLDPPGVACRDLRECLLIQIRRAARPDGRIRALMEKIVEDHLHDLQTGKLERVAKILSVSPADVKIAVHEIKKLNPKPGSIFEMSRPFYVVPDIIFRRKRRGYDVLCNKKELPELRIHPSYRKLLRDSRTSPEIRRYLRDKLDSALALLRAMQKREGTLQRVARRLAEEQADFLNEGLSHLKPFRMEKLARELGLHKSTVSRAVADKYAETPQGVFALRDFFSHAVGGDKNAPSASAVQNKIRALIGKETPRCPLSDGKIRDLLKSKGIRVARRTVAKYRQKLRILPSYLRKK